MSNNRYTCLNKAFAAQRRLNFIKQSGVTLTQTEIDNLDQALIEIEKFIKAIQTSFLIVGGSEDCTQSLSISDPRFEQKIDPWNSDTGNWRSGLRGPSYGK